MEYITNLIYNADLNMLICNVIGFVCMIEFIGSVFGIVGNIKR